MSEVETRLRAALAGRYDIERVLGHEVASTGFARFGGGLIWAFSFSLITSWITLPVRILTSLLIRQVFEHWPPPDKPSVAGGVA